MEAEAFAGGSEASRLPPCFARIYAPWLSFSTVMNRCGKTRCACHAEPPRLHGPYITWTRKVSGKTQTRRLTPEQAERYRPWIENNRRLRELTSELEDLSLQAIKHAEGWGEK
jgi:hypothetical protein